MSIQETGSNLRVCYFGTYREQYTRNQILLKGLRSQGVTVYECHAKLWHGIEDRVEQASGGWQQPRFWWRVAKAYWQLYRRHNQTPEYDIMLIGYPGQFDSYLGRLLSWWRRKPMSLDILMSLYLVSEERGLVDKSPWTGHLISMLEGGGLKLPDQLISENSEYETYYCQRYHLQHEKFQRVPHGADETVYHPRSLHPPDDYFLISYHGLFLPSHGLDTIIKAAAILKDDDGVHFQFFGTGPEEERIKRIAEELALGNVTFRGFVGREELLDGLAQSHICLGVFGTTKQSNYTIQNKVWEGLAMGRAVITGDSASIRESLDHGEHIYLVERDNPEALAEGILTLRDNPEIREKIALGGYRRFQEGNSTEGIGATLVKALRSITSDRSN